MVPYRGPATWSNQGGPDQVVPSRRSNQWVPLQESPAGGHLQAVPYSQSLSRGSLQWGPNWGSLQSVPSRVSRPGRSPRGSPLGGAVWRSPRWGPPGDPLQEVDIRVSLQGLTYRRSPPGCLIQGFPSMEFPSGVPLQEVLSKGALYWDSPTGFHPDGPLHVFPSKW
jgi:hypothetical protein